MRIPKDSYIGVLCKRDHRFKRKKKSLRSKNDSCILCSKQTSADFYKKNKTTVSKSTKLYYKNNKEKIRIHKHKWYLKNKKRIAKQQAIYHENNRADRNAKRLVRYYNNK